MKRKILASIMSLMTVLAFALLAAQCVEAAPFDQILDRWSKTRTYVDREDDISNLEIRVTYYSAEFIEAYIQKEADANLWTQQEADDYKYKFLKALRLDEMIPVQIYFNNNGPTMHLGPFDIMVSLRIKNKSYKPVDYDKRFNFAFQGKKEGLVFFPRYDEKTGKDLLEGVKRISTLQAYDITVEHDGEKFRDEYILGLVSNTYSIAGLSNLVAKGVLFDDGLFEVTLVKMPGSLIELNSILNCLIKKDLNPKYFCTFKTSHVRFTSDHEIAWTLDGESGGSYTVADIENHRQAVKIIVKGVPEETAESVGSKD